jgi:hypothetical protein
MKKNKRQQKKRQNRQPWAWAAALLIGCVITLVCMAQKLDPDVILVRVLIASGVTGASVSVSIACIRGLVSKS